MEFFQEKKRRVNVVVPDQQRSAKLSVQAWPSSKIPGSKNIRKKRYLYSLPTLSLLSALAFAADAFAADQGPLYGKWGTQTQCAGELLTPGGTKRATPFEIGKDWLGHGDVWCRLFWSTAAPTSDGLFAAARALCGEDAVVDYRINFNLDGSELTLIWNMQFENGPLMRCPETN